MEAALEATDVTNKFIYMAIIKIVYFIIVLLIPIVLIHAFIIYSIMEA